MRNFGALIGWEHQDLGEKLVLRVETVSSNTEAAKLDPDITHVFLTKQQAALLGTYLVKASGLTVRAPASGGFFRKLFA